MHLQPKGLLLATSTLSLAMGSRGMLVAQIPRRWTPTRLCMDVDKARLLVVSDVIAGKDASAFGVQTAKLTRLSNLLSVQSWSQVWGEIPAGLELRIVVTYEPLHRVVPLLPGDPVDFSCVWEGECSEHQ